MTRGASLRALARVTDLAGASRCRSCCWRSASSGTAGRSRSISRFWDDIVDRVHGPMTFRFFLQPTMAALAALPDGIRDARARTQVVLLDGAVGHRTQRAARLREGADLDRAHHAARAQHGHDLPVQGVRPLLSGGSVDDGDPARRHSVLHFPLDRRARRALVVRAQVTAHRGSQRRSPWTQHHLQVRLRS